MKGRRESGGLFINLGTEAACGQHGLDMNALTAAQHTFPLGAHHEISAGITLPRQDIPPIRGYVGEETVFPTNAGYACCTRSGGRILSESCVANSTVEKTYLSAVRTLQCPV